MALSMSCLVVVAVEVHQCGRGDAEEQDDERGVAKPRITEKLSNAPGVCMYHLLARRRVQPKNRFREYCTSGTVPGAPGNRRPYG